MRKLLIQPSFSSICYLLYCFLVTFAIRAATALPPNGTIPAIIAFGDSILDTGNNNLLLTIVKCNFPPYGRDFPGRIPTGRWCNGKVPTDLIAEALGIKDTVPAYLNPTVSSNDLATGVCFASGGSGLDTRTSFKQQVVSMADQLRYFKEHISKLEAAVGADQAKTIISKALILMSAGNNDIALTYYGGGLFLGPVSLYADQIVAKTSDFLKNLYELGARRFGVLGTLPLGCLPAARALGPCLPNVNAAASLFNTKLEALLGSLGSALPEAKLVYIDVFNPLLNIIQNPQQSGFQIVNRGCLGLAQLPCLDDQNYVFWDFAHPSEKAYRIIVSQIIEKYSDKFA